MNKKNSFDIAVIGGGLAGLTQSILLGQQGWQVVCIDRENPVAQLGTDIRTTAISWGSRNLLKNAGIWPELESRSACIRDIIILDEDSPIELVFHSADLEAEGFGWIVDNRDLRQSLLSHIKNLDAVTHITGQSVTGFVNTADDVTVHLQTEEAITARLVIGADGRNSFTRECMGIGIWEHDYKTSAIVCLIEHEHPHNGLAVEHFRAQGPFAVLPFTDDEANGCHRSAIVWSVPTQEAAQWMQCPDDVLNTALQTRCGDRFGKVRTIGTRSAWPLNLKKAYHYTTHRMVLVAEAAHGIHPIAGQGLNMSLRDIAVLTELLDGASDPGDAAILKEYQTLRRGDNVAMAVATDGLDSLFRSNFFGIRAARRFGLHAVSKIPFAKRFFMKQAMGAVGHLPSLIRDVS